MRQERARLLAALVHHLGPNQLALAEDVAQDAMLAALQRWEADRPVHPGPWLRRVAMNRAIDHLRRSRKEVAIEQAPEPTIETELADHLIEDEALRMLYLSCQPGLALDEQLTLCLNLAAGFTARDIASVLLKPQATVAQRLVRLKRKLRSKDVMVELDDVALRERSPVVLRALYLMFCAGYEPSTGELTVSNELIEEALRLVRLYIQRAPQDGEGAALGALLCLHASRTPARTVRTVPVHLSEQDRSLWDQSLLEEATELVQMSQRAPHLSRYHIEAAIAFQHAVAPSFEVTDWHRISLLYRQLHEMTQSPLAQMSGALATLFAGDREAAYKQLRKLQDNPAIEAHAAYQAALAEACHATGRTQEAEAARALARRYQKNTAARAFIDARFTLLG